MQFTKTLFVWPVFPPMILSQLDDLQIIFQNTWQNKEDYHTWVNIFISLRTPWVMWCSFTYTVTQKKSITCFFTDTLSHVMLFYWCRCTERASRNLRYLNMCDSLSFLSAMPKWPTQWNLAYWIHSCIFLYTNCLKKWTKASDER